VNTTTESYFFAKDGQVYPATAWKLYSYVSTDEPYDNEGHRVLIEVYDDPDNYLTVDDLNDFRDTERMAGQYIDFTIYDTVTNQSFADYEYIEATDREDMLTEFNLIMDVDWPEDRYEVSINRIHEDV